MKKTNFTLLMAIVSLSVTSLFLQGCDEDGDGDFGMENKYQNFLDLDVSSNVQFTQTELTIMKDAFQRIVQCSSYDGKQVTLALSAKQMNMSERLLKYLYSGLSIDNSFAYNTIPKIKTRSESKLTVGVGFSQTLVHLSRSETLRLMTIIQNCNSVYEFEMSAAAGLFGTASGTLVSGYYLLKGVVTSNSMEAFGNSNANGSTFTQMNISVPGSGYYTTTYQFSYGR